MKPLMLPAFSKRLPAKHYSHRRSSRYQDQSVTFASLSVCPAQAYRTAPEDSPQWRQTFAPMPIIVKYP